MHTVSHSSSDVMHTSQGKRERDVGKGNEEASVVKKAKVEETNKHRKPVARDNERQSSYLRPGKLAIGSCVCPINTKLCGTVGPFLKIKETGDLCFLTVRHIFGPFKSPEKFLGTKVHLKTSRNDEDVVEVCGHVVAAEYDEGLDIALVQVSEDFVPSRIKFIDVADEDFKAAGLYAANIQLSNTAPAVFDARELTPQQTETHRLVKFGSSSGLTAGRLYLHEGKVIPKTFTFRRDEPNYKLTEILLYTNQYRALPVRDRTFAKDSDVGAAVYLVEKSNLLGCVGIVTRIMRDGVLVTPMQEIIARLEQQLGKSLEVVPIHSKHQTTYGDRSLFSRALKEGEEQDRHVRVNIIGFYAQGKTTLTRRLLNESYKDVDTTDGIDVHIRRCKINEMNWKKYDTKQEPDELSWRLVSVAKSVASSTTNTTDTEDDDVLDLTTEFEGQGLSTDDLESSPQTTNNNEKIVDTDTPTRPIDSKPSVKCLPLFRRFSDDLSEDRTISEDELIATIWDFGGQYVYYATHQIFHSRDAVYLLVFDLSKGLDNVLEDYDFPDRQEKMKTSLMFWVNSINAFVGTDDGSKPKIILVGTHKDQFSGDTDAKFEEVKELFAGTDLRNHIYDRTFAVANVDGIDDDEVIEELRKTIYQIGEDTASCRLIPAKWIPLELALLQVRHKNIITFNEVIELDSKNDIPIRNRNQIKMFLKYHHEKGTLVFFDEEGLDSHVILNPQFLIDAFRCIITSKTICGGSAKLYRLWKKMTSMAVLEKEVIDAVWSKEKNPDFFKFSNILLGFLKRHRILAELQTDECSDKLVGMGRYMIPSFLKSNCSDQTAEEFLSKKTCSSVLLGICLENNTVLATVYERITAAALGRWPPIKFEDQYLVFQNVGYYRLDRQHAGMITKREGKGIELMVIILCPSGEDIGVVSDRFRRYVEMVISQEFWKLHNDARENPYSLYIKCNHFDHGGRGSRESHGLNNIRKDTQVCCPDYKDHSVDVRRTVEEWFQEEKISKKQTGCVRHVEESDLNKIAQAIGSNWQLLGIGLGLTGDKIERIKEKNRDSGTATVIFYMLKEWKNLKRSNADLNDLIKTMGETDALSVNWDKIGNFLDNF